MKFINQKFPGTLKVLSFAFLLTALFLLPSSCNKEANEDQQELEATANAQEEEAPPERYEYYLDSEKVDKGTFDPEDKKLIVDISGEPDPEVEDGGLIKIWAFTSTETYFAWGDAHGLPVECRYNLRKHLADYAETSGAIAHYERTREILPEYETYANEYLARMDCSVERSGERGYGFLYKHYFEPNAWFISAFTFFMPPGWNNTVSRYFTFGIYNGLSVFDKTFFREHMHIVWNWGWNYWFFWYDLEWLNDQMSSSILF